MRLAVISDLHVMGSAEHQQNQASVQQLGNELPRFRRRLRRSMHKVRDRFWHWDTDSRKACFHEALEQVADYNPDWLVANGDFGGDHLGVGLSDDHTFDSVATVTRDIRDQFPGRHLLLFGDHDIGKYSTLRREGGIRLLSMERGRELGLRSFWQVEHKGFHLLGINSLLFILDLFLPEALEEEIPTWRDLQEAHMEEVEQAFAELPRDARIILFCHDPSALSVLAAIPAIRDRCAQVERTIIGHLHAPVLLQLAKPLRHLPRIKKSRYPVARIISHGIQGARDWRHFNPAVCPSTYGVGNHVSGGVLFVETDAGNRIRTCRKRITA